MSGGKGGSTTSKVEIPQYIEDASKANLARADQVAQIGYVPYMGPEVAAMSGDQMAAMQNTNAMAQAMGMQTAQPSLPTPVQTFANGVQGYSSYPIYEESIAAHQQAYPGQARQINSMFGGSSANTPYAQNPYTPLPVVSAPYDYSSDSDSDHSMPTTSSPYTSFGDMFDGGGPGTSGNDFEGGGLISSTANAVGYEPIGSDGSDTGGGK